MYGRILIDGEECGSKFKRSGSTTTPRNHLIEQHPYLEKNGL